MPMVFKGGTSLSKVFNLIDRFSEDIDITLDSAAFEPNLCIKKLNRSQIKRLSTQLKLKLKQCTQETILPFLMNEIEIEFPGKPFKLALDETGEKLFIYYPSVIEQSTEYLRDHILLEFGIRNSILPSEQKTITSYLASILNYDLVLPNAMFNVLSPLRTFWEKATLLHAECHRKRIGPFPQRLSRHWYDLYQLAHSWVGEAALADIELLNNVVFYKKTFFNASYTHYDDCLQGKFKLVPEPEYLAGLRHDFQMMKRARMFLKSPPAFHEIIEFLHQLEDTINAIVSQKKLQN
jgi:predicted nucleotidyltransferase component of viral defense system